MRCLDPFLATEYVQNIINSCRGSRAVQGILVEIHPIWLAAWKIGERYNPNDPGVGFEEALAEGREVQLPSLDEFQPVPPPSWLPFRPLSGKDLGWRPSIWPAVDRNGTYSQWPIAMHICLYPGGGEAPLFRGEGFAIRYEVRPIARFYAGPKDQHRPVVGGVSVGVNPTDAGTMGGIVKAASGKNYGVTCGHLVGTQTIVQQPAAIDGKGTIIGKVVESHVPPSFPSHAARVEREQQQYATRVDAALIEIDSRTTIAKLEILKMGRVTQIVSLKEIQQNEELQFTGRSSDWMSVNRGFFSPYYNVTDEQTGREYCYECPLIFRDPSGGAAARPGDSGSWLCKEVGADYHWVAMVVGGDPQLGFAVAAEEIKTWWESLPCTYGLSLQ